MRGTFADASETYTVTIGKSSRPVTATSETIHKTDTFVGQISY